MRWFLSRHWLWCSSLASAGNDGKRGRRPLHREHTACRPWTCAVQQDIEVSSNGTQYAGIISGLLSTDTPLSEPQLWHDILFTGVGSTLSGLCLTTMVTMHFVNFKWVRWDRVLYVFLSGVLPTMLVFGGSLYWLSLPQSEAQRDVARSVILLGGFIVQVIPAWVTPYMYSGVLKGLVSSPIKLSLLSLLLTSIVAVVLLEFVTPAFSTGSSSTRIIIRLVAFPLLIEIPVGAVRTAARFWMEGDFPLDRMLTAMLGPVVLSSMVGRFLATNMETLWETVGVSILLSGIELLMRMSMLARDDCYVQCCGRMCGGLDRKRKHGRPENRAWVQFMLLETMFEDIGILLSLPVTLVFRIPPIPGGTPLSAWDVVVRVILQLVIESLTDVGYALGYYAMVRCCGVQYNSVTASDMQSCIAAQADSTPRTSSRFLLLPTRRWSSTRMPSRGSISRVTIASAEPQAPVVLDDAQPAVGRGAVQEKESVLKGGEAGSTPASPQPTRSESQGPPAPAAFCSCSPVCLSPHSRAVEVARANLRAELQQEVQWETEFVWEPVPLALVLQQSRASAFNAQVPGQTQGALPPATSTRSLQGTQDGSRPATSGSCSGLYTPAGEPRNPSDVQTPTHHTAAPHESHSSPSPTLQSVSGRPASADLWVLAALRMELFSIRLLRAWETRFKYYTFIVAAGALAGSLYVLRTFVGGLCPYGDSGRPETWVFDTCQPTQ